MKEEITKQDQGQLKKYPLKIPSVKGIKQYAVCNDNDEFLGVIGLKEGHEDYALPSFTKDGILSDKCKFPINSVIELTSIESEKRIEAICVDCHKVKVMK
jgi:hypothetical protein